MLFYFDIQIISRDKVKVLTKDFVTEEVIAARTISNYPQFIMKAENDICELLETDYYEQWELIKK